MAAILARKIRKGDVIVIRYEGPKGGPGMREMLSPTSAIMGQGLGKEVALITDGRFSGGTHGFRGGPHLARGPSRRPARADQERRHDHHRRPRRLLNLDVPARELAKRRKALKFRPPVRTRGVLAKYADHVSQAHLGGDYGWGVGVIFPFRHPELVEGSASGKCCISSEGLLCLHPLK